MKPSSANSAYRSSKRWGLTETAAQILSNPMPPGERKIGSPGVAIGNEVIIGDAAQREMPLGEEGEVLVRGP